jgi:acyl-CoA thioesterase I
MWTFLLCFSCTVQTTNEQASTETVPKENSSEAITPEAIAEFKPRIVILGDSLTAGLGLDVDSAYPALVERQLTDLGYPTEILNAGQSGDTTAGGVQRVDWLLKQKTDLLIVELGANDGMRGIPVSEVEKNLNTIIDKSQEANVLVFLMDMYIPTNFGKEYTDGFHNLFATIATEQDITLLPFLLKDVAGKPTLNQADGIHPTAEGHQLMADVVLNGIQDWRKGIDTQQQSSQ